MTPARHELPPEPSKDEDNYGKIITDHLLNFKSNPNCYVKHLKNFYIGLDDLKSDEDTDDEDCPRKEVPKWAEGTQLRTALLKQCYMGPDLDKIFTTVEMPDLSTMFDHQRKRYCVFYSLERFYSFSLYSFFKRTSSACWETPPESFKHSKRW